MMIIGCIVIGAALAALVEAVGAVKQRRTLLARLERAVKVRSDWKSIPRSLAEPIGGAALAASISFLIYPEVSWIHALAVLMGAWIPSHRRREQLARMRWNALRQFPDFLELLSVAISSGLTLDRAWGVALRYFIGPDVKPHLEEAHHRMASGELRAEALKRLSERFNDNRLDSVLVLIRQALLRGAPLQSVLVEQARSLRSVAMFSMEKRAQTAGIRLLFPIMFFIFPTVFLVLFAPLIIQIKLTGRLF